jgi:hypothetical protein
MTKREIAEQRAAQPRRYHRSMFGDWWTVGVLLVVLQLIGVLKVGWGWTGGIFAGYVLGDILWLGVKSLFRRNS